MAESLTDNRLSDYTDLVEVCTDFFGKVFEGCRKTDKHRVLIRLLDTPIQIAEVKKSIEDADKDDFLTDIEVVDSTMMVTEINDYNSIGQLNRLEINQTLPLAEFEALGIIGAVLPKLIKAEKDQKLILNLRPSLLFVKRIAAGRPVEGQPSHILKIAEPYQHVLFQSSETVTDPFVALNFKTGEKLLSHSLGCLMYHLVFGEPISQSQRDNNSLSYLYSHYMFQLTKSNARERQSLGDFERSQRTFKDCEALVVYPTARVVNLLTSKGFYSGEVRYGLMHGRGAFTAHKDLYSGLEVAASEGVYCLDKLHHRGLIVYRSGDRYEGQVQWDAPRGEGTLTRLSGTVVRGEWEGSSLVEGTEGEILIPDYSNYRGQISKNQPHGAGLMLYNDGLIYKGEFKLGQRHGSGFMYRKDGEQIVYSYNGSWYENEKHGEGEEATENLRYKGNFHLGKKHGQGNLSDPSSDGWAYEGEFKQDQYHGLGMLVNADGEKYNGEFKNGKRHGYGCSENPDGSVYDGQWEGDKPHGEGSLTDPEGNTVIGVWLNGEQVEYD